VKAATFHSRKYLSAGQMIDRTAECPVCLSQRPRRAIHVIQRNPIVELLACPSCRACSASHMPTRQTLDEYYSSYYDQKDQMVTFRDTARFAHNLLAPIRARWPARARDSLRILDYGGGDGSLALAAAAQILHARETRSVQILLVDYVGPAPTTPSNVTLQHVRPVDQIDGEWDLIVASAILEHVPEVNPVLHKLFESVAPGGYFYARTPYVAPFTAVMRNLDLTYPAHVHDMGSSFWNRAAEIFSFDADYVATRTSIVETEMLRDPLRTLAAYVLKAPSRFEELFSTSRRRDRFWNLVGGWEVLLRRRDG